MPKQKADRTKVTPPPKKEKPVEFIFFVGQLLLGMGTYLRVWLIYTVRMHWSKRVSLPQQVSTEEFLG